MVKGIDVANFFIKVINAQPEGNVTNLQLNKLVYYAQAWNLVLKGEPLFEEDFQAWDYGPVLPTVYNTFKKYGKNLIVNISGNYSHDIFSNDEINFLIDVYREYGKYSPNELVYMTHTLGGPWHQVYKHGENEIIPKDLIKDFYSKQPKLQEWTPHVKKENIVGYINEDGITVLPADWDDDGDFWDEEAKKHGLI